MTHASLALKRILLAMLGGQAPPSLDGDAWSAVDAMAGQHRLLPLLSWHLDRVGALWDVPPAISGSWREARHAAGIAALTQLAGLRLAADRLEGAGTAFVVLKGPRLAWRCYPEAGLRPMRDLDLLVSPGDVTRAADVLAAAGFEPHRDQAALAEALATAKHLPPMAHRGLGVEIELHQRLSDLPHVHRYRIPQLDPRAALSRTELAPLAGTTLPVQRPLDLLVHLMVHALYGHRLDCGPLVLADIHFLLDAEPVDAGAFRQIAEDGGWLRGAQLLVALTERYFGPQDFALGGQPPESVIAAAEEALLQDPSGRRQAFLLGDLLAARSPAAFAASLAKRWRPAAHVVAEEGDGKSPWRFWPRWAWRRLTALVRALGDRRASREAGRAATLLRWLEG